MYRFLMLEDIKMLSHNYNESATTVPKMFLSLKSRVNYRNLNRNTLATIVGLLLAYCPHCC